MREPYEQVVVVPRIGALGGDNWTLRRLNSITVLFGKNGSGKSLLLRAWRDQGPDEYHYVVPERTGEMDYQAAHMTKQLSGQQRRGLSQRNFLNDYRRHVVARIQAYFSTRGNVRGDTLPGDPADLEKLLGQLLPDFDIALHAGSPPYQLSRSIDSQPVGNIDQLSSGEAQLLTVGLDILTIAAIWDLEKRQKRVILIDEPDAHIHPDLQVRFADFLVQVAEKYDLQLVIATHSTTLMAAPGQFADADASVLYLDRTKTEFEAQRFTEMTKELAACLGGHALMGPLFGVPMLLVEGDDDYRIWSQVPRHHVVSFAVIPSHGDEIKRYQRTLEKLFGSLRETDDSLAGYALIDADKGKPHPSDQNPQDHVRFIQLGCHESENLFLCDEVLRMLDIDWAVAKAKIVEQAEHYGNKAGKLRSVGTWDRKSHDIKDVVEELSRILDGKNVHWTSRVAQAIGRKRPQGQLADFLGDEVVTSIWGDPPAAAAPSGQTPP